jgi:hypothetical protein
LVTDVLTRVLKEAGVRTIDLPDGVRVSKRGDARVWVNFTEETVKIDGGPEIGPIGYVIEPVGAGR